MLLVKRCWFFGPAKLTPARGMITHLVSEIPGPDLSMALLRVLKAGLGIQYAGSLGARDLDVGKSTIWVRKLQACTYPCGDKPSPCY